jgi:hypothetical protein
VKSYQVPGSKTQGQLNKKKRPATKNINPLQRAVEEATEQTKASLCQEAELLKKNHGQTKDVGA